MVEGCRRYYDLANDPKDYVVIEGAGHTFDEDKVEEGLFKETLKWIKTKLIQ